MRSTFLRPRLGRAAVVLLAGTLVLGTGGVARADLSPDPLRDPAGESVQTLQRNVLSKATPDRCFYGTDVPMGEISPDGTCPTKTFTLADQSTVSREGTPKVNQAYVWGLAKSANGRLWWGTGPNIHCLVLQGYLGIQEPVQTSSYVCDPDQNFVPPDIYMYDESTGVQTDLRTRIADQAERLKLGATLGIRSAGAAKGVVFFAGPGVNQTGGVVGINLFAFDDSTGAYLGSTTLPAYTNIRKWVVVGGELYTGVAVRPDTEHPTGGGMVLRWTGSKADPFAFQQVGFVDGEAAELAEHDGRLFVSTWPCCETDGGLTGGTSAAASLWMSPALGSDGMLTDADAATGAWTKVWRATDYEPDPVVARTYGGGALVSYGGKLYWGTMHVPGTAYGALTAVYGERYPAAMGPDAYVRANRAIAIFRGDDFTDGRTDTPIEVLYGDAKEWAFDATTGAWSQQPTGGQEGTPTGGGSYGASGFGTPFNNYTWTMSVYDGQMFVGTMDHTYLIKDLLDEPRDEVSALTTGDGLLPDDSLLPTLAGLVQSLPLIRSGADLWRFPAPGAKAVPESLEGVGNYLNYGVRTMLADSAGLYLGSANPMNLMTDTTDAYPEGGWELIKLTAKGSPPPPPPPAPDTTAPVSKASAPAVSTKPSWQVTYTATDESSGVAKVELFVKGPGAVGFTSAGVDTVATGLDGKLPFDSTAGAGDYAFYTVATDKAGNVESVPAAPDAVTTYREQSRLDTTAPVSKAHSAKLSRQEELRVRYTAKDERAGSGLADVALYVKAPGASSYTRAATDSGSQIDGSFGYTAAAGEGVYRFYTVATDLAGNQEAVPARADTWIRYDATPPMVRPRTGPGPLMLQVGDRLKVRMQVQEKAHLSFVVRHRGRIVKPLGAGSVRRGVVVCSWNGRDRHGRLVGPGRYVLVTKARDMAGNATTLRTVLRVHR